MASSKVSATYFLPEEYEVNPIATTRDTVRESVYWNKNRLRNAYYYQFPVYSYCEKLIESRKATSLIDIGCGVGRKLVAINGRFPKLDIVGLDQAHPIGFCNNNYSFGRWYTDDFENPAAEFDSLKSDVVICSDVIEHVENPDLLINYIKSKCNPGGVAVISTPDRTRLLGRGALKPSQPDHVREWASEEFTAYLHSQGCNVLEHDFTYPTKMGLNTLWPRELYRQIKRKADLRYNQIVLVEFD